MSQLALDFKKTKYHIVFTTEFDNAQLSELSYRCRDELDHLKLLKDIFINFTKRFKAGEESIGFSWDNEDNVRIILSFKVDRIKIYCEKDGTAYHFAIPVVDKAKVLANLYNIIKTIKLAIKPYLR